MSSRRVTRKIIDIGANLTDDFTEVLQRAKENGIEKIIVTGGSVEDSLAALQLANSHINLYSTVGCHPTRCTEFEQEGNSEEYYQKLLSLATDNVGKVVAIGECGLDYDRLQFCPKDIQKKYFQRQFDIAESTGLPMFLHCRNAAPDLLDILCRNRDRFKTGVVHSFDGSAEDAKSIIDLDLFLGINGCSLKSEENLTVVETIPVERLTIETDCPWCEIRPTHAAFKYVETKFSTKKKEKWESNFQVKGRNEPCNLVQVLEVVAALKGEDVNAVAEIVYQTTNRIFFTEYM